MSATLPRSPAPAWRSRLPIFSQAELIGTLVSRDLKSRYKQSLLGFAWAVVTPLCMAFIYTLIGYYFLKQRTGAVPFPIYAYTGLLFWNLFAGGVSAATESLVAHIALITKVYFPREVFPISAVLGKIADFGFGLLGLIPLLFIFHVGVGWGSWIVLPVMAVLLLFATGLGLLTSCANLYFRDVRHLVGIVLTLWIYMVPNFYTLDRIPEKYQSLYLLNPIATLIETARRGLFPVVGEPLPPKFMLFATGVSVILFIVGYTVFKRSESQFAEHI